MLSKAVRRMWWSRHPGPGKRTTAPAFEKLQALAAISKATASSNSFRRAGNTPQIAFRVRSGTTDLEAVQSAVDASMAHNGTSSPSGAAGAGPATASLPEGATLG